MAIEIIGQRPSFTALPNWLRGQATPLEGWVLWCLQSHFPNIHPSLSLLAKEACIARSTLCTVLTGMERKGWLVREQGQLESGRRANTRYRLTIWDIRWQVDSDSPGGGLVRETDHQRVAGIVRETDGDSPGDGLEVDQGKKRKPTAIEPPLPPAAQGAHDRTEQARIERGAARPFEPQAEALPQAKAIRDRDGFLIHPGQLSAIEPQPVATQPQPQQPNAPRPLPAPPDPEAVVPVEPKARKRREPGFQPTAEDVPAALLPVVSELLAFWACKGGKRTERAWVAQLGQLRQIQDDPAGGTDAARSQLEAGSQAAVFGKAWMAVTYANWKRFGLRAGTPIAGTGFPGKRSTMDRVMGAMALIEQRERGAAVRRAEPGALALAEVA